MPINKKGLSRLDFDEAKQIAKRVDFDIKACAKRLRSCGPGAKYYENDKRFFVLMLLKHIEQIKKNNTGDLPEKVSAWHKLALQAVEEYKKIENLTWSSWKKV